MEDLGDEVLVYDRQSDTAHCLTASAALVWRACGDGLTMQGLLARESIDRDTVECALSELEEQGLLESTGLRVYHTDGGITRRQAIGRLAAAAAVPLVFSVAAPTAWGTHASPRVKGACSGNGCLNAGYVTCGSCSCPTGVCPSASTVNCQAGGSPCDRRCCPIGWSCGTGTPGMCTHP